MTWGEKLDADRARKAAPPAGGPQAPSEICICAAVRLDDGYIVRGHRHDDCIQTVEKFRAAGKMIGVPRQDQQGFVTSKNRFVGRKEAMVLQRAAGIPSADLIAKGFSDPSLRGDILFSEDLY